MRASGSVSYQRRERRGNRVLKRIFYRSAFSAISCHAPSQEYYRRKRSEGKTAQQVVICLARRRVNVLWAMLRDGSIYEDRPAPAARKRRQDALGPHQPAIGAGKGAFAKFLNFVLDTNKSHVYCVANKLALGSEPWKGEGRWGSGRFCC